LSDQPRIAEPFQGESEEYTDYERCARRRTLFRVLASNLVRELRSAGHRGTELLGFVSQLMEAVTDEGFGDPTGHPGTSSVAVTPPPLQLSADTPGRSSMSDSLVTLRPPTPEDAPAFERWQADPLTEEGLEAIQKLQGKLLSPLRRLPDPGEIVAAVGGIALVFLLVPRRVRHRLLHPLEGLSEKALHPDLESGFEGGPQGVRPGNLRR